MLGDLVGVEEFLADRGLGDVAASGHHGPEQAEICEAEIISANQAQCDLGLGGDRLAPAGAFEGGGGRPVGLDRKGEACRRDTGDAVAIGGGDQDVAAGGGSECGGPTRSIGGQRERCAATRQRHLGRGHPAFGTTREGRMDHESAARQNAGREGGKLARLLLGVGRWHDGHLDRRQLRALDHLGVQSQGMRIA